MRSELIISTQCFKDQMAFRQALAGIEPRRTFITSPCINSHSTTRQCPAACCCSQAHCKGQEGNKKRLILDQGIDEEDDKKVVVSVFVFPVRHPSIPSSNINPKHITFFFYEDWCDMFWRP